MSSRRFRLTPTKRRLLRALEPVRWRRLPDLAPAIERSRTQTFYHLRSCMAAGLVEHVAQAGWRLAKGVVVSDRGSVYRVVWTLQA